MIKKYLDFIKENSQNVGNETFGEWVETLFNEHEYIRNIVNRYLDSESDIRLANAINILDDNDKRDIKYQIEKYLSEGIVDKKPVVTTMVDMEMMESDLTMAGKGVFTSFLKSLTALGQKDVQKSIETPKDYLIYYKFEKLNSEDVKQIFDRFKSFQRFIDYIKYDKNELNLYFGIKCDGNFEYGILYDENIPFGGFKLSNNVIKWLLGLETKSGSNLKKDLVNMTYNNIITLGKIKNDMNDYNPSFFEKKSLPVINDKIISFGFMGLGKWDNGKLDEAEYQNIKTNFNNWIFSKKWSEYVLINIKPSSYWVWINIKLK